MVWNDCVRYDDRFDWECVAWGTWVGGWVWVEWVGGWWLIITGYVILWVGGGLRLGGDVVCVWCLCVCVVCVLLCAGVVVE